MNNNNTNLSTVNNPTLDDLFANEAIKEKFAKVLGGKQGSFMASVLQAVKSNAILKKADGNTILAAAMTAAILDLPINNNLGFAYIVPFGNKAQFQIGWKGFVQLALRTGQYKTINVTEVYQNQYRSFNSLTEELDADFSKEAAGEVVGYAAYLKFLNGFEKTVYWSKEKVIAHAKKYSKTFNSTTGAWQTSFHAMAKKTVIKNTIGQWGIMSIEQQTAIFADQAVQEQEGIYQYVDNPNAKAPVASPAAAIESKESKEDEETRRILKFIKEAKNNEDLGKVIEVLSLELRTKFDKEITDKVNYFYSLEGEGRKSMLKAIDEAKTTVELRALADSLGSQQLELFGDDFAARDRELREREHEEVV